MAAKRPRGGPARARRVRETPAAYSAGSGRLLVDTHVWLWWRAADSRLNRSARDAITNAAEVHFSAASAWELAIKRSLGKLRLPPGADVAAALARDGFLTLPISVDHAIAAGGLPGIHRDPCDRMLVAQARIEDLTLVTADALLARYDVPVLLAGK